MHICLLLMELSLHITSLVLIDFFVVVFNSRSLSLSTVETWRLFLMKFLYFWSLAEFFCPLSHKPFLIQDWHSWSSLSRALPCYSSRGWLNPSSDPSKYLFLTEDFSDPHASKFPLQALHYLVITWPVFFLIIPCTYYSKMFIVIFPHLNVSSISTWTRSIALQTSLTPRKVPCI